MQFLNGRLQGRIGHRIGHGIGALPMMAMLLVSACANTSSLDWDLRNNGGATADAAGQASASRPAADANGVISYPGYQVVVARRGDTVSSVAARLAIPAGQLASYNALQPDNPLRDGEILALPVRVAADAAALPSATITGQMIGSDSTGTAGGLDVAAIATSALDRVGTTGSQSAPQSGSAQSASTLPFATKGSGPVPVRYQVKRGETAFTIARSFNISAKALADWNGLGPELTVREGQYLIIPTPADISRLPASATIDATPPGQGSPTPEPPSARLPLPTQKTETAAQAAQHTSPAPDLGPQRTAASASAMGMPVDGKIIRSYDGKTNQGIDIAAPAGTAVHAAQDGTVAVITHDAKTGALIIILRHAGGLLTVYTGLDSATVAKDATVKRGQTLGTVKTGNPAQIHFEVRQGQQAVNPLTYLQ
jgi:murein DD-endopeptidase MepM/ murein hydrolase activator NlpD